MSQITTDTFYLSNVSEGVSAKIHRWYVHQGDFVKFNQPIVSLEIANQFVEVASTFAGKIVACYGGEGDTIFYNSALVEYLATEGEVDRESFYSMVSEATSEQYTEPNSLAFFDFITNVAYEHSKDILNSLQPGEAEVLRGARRAMAVTMMESQQQVVPVTIYEDADISLLQDKHDITVYLLQALLKGVQAEPAINAWFDGTTLERRLFPEINVGLGIDTAAGLFMPVLKDIAKFDPSSLRSIINDYKKSVLARDISASHLHGATIILANFGTLAGRYATPVIFPPAIATLACGKARDQVVVEQGKMVIRTILPLSLTIDHRAITASESGRFLAAVVKHLQNPLPS